MENNDQDELWESLGGKTAEDLGLVNPIISGHSHMIFENPNFELMANPGKLELYEKIPFRKAMDWTLSGWRVIRYENHCWRYFQSFIDVEQAHRLAVTMDQWGPRDHN